MTTTLLSKILNYEQEVFNEYLDNRKKMLKFIKKIEINKLDQSQLLIFIENLKNVLEPIKSSKCSIEELISFKKSNVINENQFILFYLLFGKLFFGGVSDSDSNEETLSDSSPELVSLSESESE